MRGLVKEVRDLIRAGEVDDAVTQAQSAAAGLVDRIMWRAIIVIAFFFAMLVGYRLLRPPPR